MCLATGLYSASSICSVIGSSRSLLIGYLMCPYLFLYREACQFSLAEERFSAPQYFYTDRSKAVLLLWFLTVTFSCCPNLYFGSAIVLVTYFVNFR